jgi:hypothetical protein
MCRVGVTRLGASSEEELMDALRERMHSPVVKDCMDRCSTCEKGSLIATADGMPLAAKDGVELLAMVDALEA